ncbi:MAG: phosphate:Na+ symporter [Rhodospirillaceae bacterium]|nr:phosphate:Na+ symporter [Rhodospirillaceae bacterium]
MTGAAALLLWGLRMVSTGVLRAYGADLRRAIGRSMRNRFAAFASGLGVTMLLQSSTATALMAASFASRGLVSTGAALAIMLGADVGTSLVAQLVSFRIGWLSPALILIGVITFKAGRSTRVRDLGRAAIGLGLILLGLHLIGQAAAPMRDSPITADIFSALSGQPAVAVLMAALLTLLSTSSLAVILLVISFTASGIVGPDVAFALVLGANLGSAGIPLLATVNSDPEARRVPLGNALFRLTGVIAVLPLLPIVTPWFARIESQPWRQVADFHTAFNLALAVVFIGLTGPVARICTRLLPDRPRGEDSGKPRYLDPAAMESPAAAIANAARETLRMGDVVCRMLADTLPVFRQDDRKLLREVEQMDNDVDALHEAIKLYLTEVTRESLDTRDQKRGIDVITFTTNLEHIGDIIDKNLMELAAKKIKNKLRFSDEGFAEIERMHRRLMGNLDLALNVFITGEVAMARRLLEEKVAFRELERAASESHLARLRSGKLESLETSSLHLDVLRDLKRINSHLTSVAYPILDAAGELERTRLKQEHA